MKSFLITYKRYFLIIIIGLFLWKTTSRQFGSATPSLGPSWQKESISSSSGEYHNIQGLLLDGPSGNNRKQRSEKMGQNTFIKGWIYDLTYTNAKGFFKYTSKKNPIDLIVEQDKYEQFGDDFGKLQQEFSSYPSITLFSDRNLNINNMHAKTFVGDKRRVIQTANLNRSSFYDNREHFFFGQDEMIRKNLLDLFALDIKTITDRKKYKKEYLTLTQSFSPNLVVCPLDCRQKIESLLSSAQKSIRISAQYITDENIMDILRNKSHLDVHILTNDMESNRDLVRYFGKDIVRFEQPTQYNHDKMIIVDQARMFVGSTNLSQNALDNNREIGIILTDSKFIDQQKKLFQ